MTLKQGITRTVNRNDELRYSLVSQVYENVFDDLKLDISESERKLHFSVALNERIKRSDLDYKQVLSYFDKLIKKNHEISYYQQRYLKEYIAKKAAIVMIYNFSVKNLCRFIISKYFFTAIGNVLFRRDFIETL